MWLLDVSTLQLCEYFSADIPPYAILSHKWGPEEVSFREMQDGLDDHFEKVRNKAGYRKIQNCCDQAKQNGYRYTWVDSCCIDKSSSAELTEAVSSMFKWYQKAEVCYVHLSNVPGWVTFRDDAFKASCWFTRGWTLQELLAPERVHFFAADWSLLGYKRLVVELSKTDLELVSTLSEITSIDKRVLMKPETLFRKPIAQKMSWASRRTTTREEDIAYCLMGLFKVNMPIIYGEGLEKAFRRLQHEIIKVSFDQTIFAWRAPSISSGLLANSPSAFAHSATVRRRYQESISGGKEVEPYAMTNLGLLINLRVKALDKTTYVARLKCSVSQPDGQFTIHIYLQRLKQFKNGPTGMYRRIRCDKFYFDKDRADTPVAHDLYVVEDDHWASLSKTLLKQLEDNGGDGDHDENDNSGDTDGEPAVSDKELYDFEVALGFRKKRKRPSCSTDVSDEDS